MTILVVAALASHSGYATPIPPGSVGTPVQKAVLAVVIADAKLARAKALDSQARLLNLMAEIKEAQARSEPLLDRVRVRLVAEKAVAEKRGRPVDD